MTVLYHFHSITGEHLATTEADLDPIDKVPMVPAHATLMKPPPKQAGKVACFDGKVWALKLDQRGQSYWTHEGDHVEITEIGISKPEDALDAAPPTPRKDQLTDALAQIDAEHARFLRDLTGGATAEERDTWKVKEEAARAMIAGTATQGQTTMITFEADGDGTDPMVLAQTILAKAEAYQTLIGMAAGLKVKAKAAIMGATNEAVLLDQVETQIEVVFTQLAQDMQAALAQLQG